MKKLYIHLLMIALVLGITLLFMPAFDSHTTDSQISMSAYAEDGDIASGTLLSLYDEEISVIPWRITSDKTLLIGKDGETYKGSYFQSVLAKIEYPWGKYKKDIKSAKISGNLYALGSLEKMFYGLSSMTDIDLSGLDTKEVYTMDSMFSGCSALESINVNGLDTSNVLRMNSMFSGCSALKSIDVSGLDTGNVGNMDQMFSGCKALQSIDLSGLDTKNVTSMKSMFSGCSSIKTIDVSGLDTGYVWNMDQMFSGCSSLKTLDLSSFSSRSYSKEMLNGCKSLKSLKLVGGDISIVLPVNMIHNDNVYYKAGVTFESTDHSYSAYYGNHVHSFKASKKLALKKISISRVKGSDRGFTVKWKKASKSDQKKFSGYQVQYCPDDLFESETKTVTAKKSRYHQYYTGTKLNKNTTYFVRIRRFKKSGGKTIYAQWSNVRVVKTK